MLADVLDGAAHLEMQSGWPARSIVWPSSGGCARAGTAVMRATAAPTNRRCSGRLRGVMPGLLGRVFLMRFHRLSAAGLFGFSRRVEAGPSSLLNQHGVGY